MLQERINQIEYAMTKVYITLEHAIDDRDIPQEAKCRDVLAQLVEEYQSLITQED